MQQIPKRIPCFLNRSATTECPRLVSKRGRTTEQPQLTVQTHLHCNSPQGMVIPSRDGIMVTLHPSCGDPLQGGVEKCRPCLHTMCRILVVACSLLSVWNFAHYCPFVFLDCLQAAIQQEKNLAKTLFPVRYVPLGEPMALPTAAVSSVNLIALLWACHFFGPAYLLHHHKLFKQLFTWHSCPSHEHVWIGTALFITAARKGTRSM